MSCSASKSKWQQINRHEDCDMRRLSSVVLLIVVVSGILTGSSSWAGKLSKAPDFTAPDLQGEKVELGALLKNGPVLVSFWATHCKPCIKELSKLEDLYPDYREKGFEILAVDVDGPRSVSRVKSKVAGLKWKFPVLLDTNKDIYRKFQVLGIPHTVLIDPQGEIRYTHTTYRSGDEKVIWEKVDQILAEGEDSTGQEEAKEQKELKEGKESGE
jgi:cytochrome c biogenesis protein CcmG/thiol:disulfide interchange protein DsbE